METIINILDITFAAVPVFIAIWLIVIVWGLVGYVIMYCFNFDLHDDATEAGGIIILIAWPMALIVFAIRGLGKWIKEQ